MDSPTLVRDQIVRGARLLARLLERGFPVTAALWAKTRHYEQWRLYLVCPRTDATDELGLYRQLHEVAGSLDSTPDDPLEPVEPLTTMIVSPDHPLAQGVLHRYRLAPESTPARLDWAVLGPTTVDGAYIYPAAMFAQPAPAAG